MKWFRRTLLAVLILAIGGVSAMCLIDRHINSLAADKIETSMTEIPVEEPPRIAVVFGAGVTKDGKLSYALYDRVITAVELYRAKRVKKLLMSGDNSVEDYDEPTAMKVQAMKLGVPEEDIILDFAGRRTYDSCYRAKEIFAVEKAILVTQEFHQPRAIYLCENAGIDSVGITANRRQYQNEDDWNFANSLP